MVIPGANVDFLRNDISEGCVADEDSLPYLSGIAGCRAELDNEEDWQAYDDEQLLVEERKSE